MQNKSLFFLSLLTLLYTGCGSSGSSNKTAQSDAQKTVDPVIYDLSQYLVPAQSQTNVYIEKKSEKKEGTHVYTDAVSSYYNDTYEVNASMIDMRVGETDIYAYTINDNNISIHNIATDKISSIKRFVEIGDVIFEEITNEEIEGLEVRRDYECKVSNHLKEKILDEVYYDVILINCIAASDGNGLVSGINVSVLSEDREEKHFAKNEGEISSEEESCNTVTVGSSTSSKKCEKVETELILVI